MSLVTKKVLVCFQRQNLFIYNHLFVLSLNAFLYFIFIYRRIVIRGEWGFSGQQRGVHDYAAVKERRRKRVIENAQCVLIGGGVSVLWSPCCLFYWPLGESGTEHLCWIDGTTWPAVYLWMILNSLKEHHESQIAVSYCHTSSPVQLFLSQPVASFYSQDQSVLL